MPKCRVNNVVLDNERKDNTYQAVLVDLALMGIVEKSTVESLLGYMIPSNLKKPIWARNADSEVTALSGDDDDDDDEDGGDE